MLYRYFRSAYT